VLVIGADGVLRLEVAVGERVEQLGMNVQVFELLTYGEQIENKDFHGYVLVGCAQCAWSEPCRSTGSGGVRGSHCERSEAISISWVAEFAASPCSPTMTTQCHSRADASFAPSTSDASF